MDTTLTWRTETGCHISLLPFGRDEPIREVYELGKPNYGLFYSIPGSLLSCATAERNFTLRYKQVVQNDLF